MRRYRWGYVRGTLACVATNIVAVQFPRVLGMAIDRIEKGTTRELILIFALILVGISLVKGVFLYAQRWILIGISREIEFDLRNDLFRKLEIEDSDFYQRYRTGDIMARMTNDLNAVRMLLGPALMYSANTIFLTVFALFFMLRISPYLTLVALAPMPLASILIQYLGRKIHDRFERIQASFSDISAQAQENYSGVRLIRAFAREESQIGLFERLNRQYIGRALRLVQLMGMLWPTLEFILGISMIITLLRRRAPGSGAPHFSGPVRCLQHLHDPAHLAHHRRGLGHQHLSARHCLGQAHRRVAQSRACHRRPRCRSRPLAPEPSCAAKSNSATSRSATATPPGKRRFCATSRCTFPRDRAWPSSAPPAAANPRSSI